MAATRIEQNLKTIAFGLGILQGLTYTILALICIILHNKHAIIFNFNSYMEKVGIQMYFFFLSPDDGETTVLDYMNMLLVHPSVFHGFAWVYFFLHLFWIGVSIAAALKNNAENPKFLMAWSHLTFLISLWDFITVVILGSDYKKCLDFASDNVIGLSKLDGESLCATTIIPVLVIAAKGFVLWIINVIFAVVLNNMALQLKKKNQCSTAAPASFPAALQPTYDPYRPQQSPQPTFQSQQPVNYSSQLSSSYPQQLPISYPTPSPSAAQNVNKNQFQYPVHIPEPDYHYQSYNQANATNRY